MEEAVRARTAAREAVGDISPDHLREVITTLLDDSSMAPGVLTLLSASVADRSASPHATADRAAGVQLIYEGLRLTRSLADAEPWSGDPPHTDANLEILAADVMVSRGFYLLARTEAADKAVQTVRAFGRDETERRVDGTGTGNELEANVFELATIAGTTATGSDVPARLREYAAELAASLDGDEPEAPETLPEDVSEAMTSLSTRRRNPRHLDEPPSSSATDP